MCVLSIHVAMDGKPSTYPASPPFQQGGSESLGEPAVSGLASKLNRPGPACQLPASLPGWYEWMEQWIIEGIVMRMSKGQTPC